MFDAAADDYFLPCLRFQTFAPSAAIRMIFAAFSPPLIFDGAMLLMLRARHA